VALSSLSTDQLVDLISSATRRVAFLAPGVQMPVAQALAGALRRLDQNSVNIIVDTRPDVFRLGYGTLEALEHLNQVANECGTLVCHQEGVQVGVLLADDVLAVYAPKPLLVAESDVELGEVNGLVIGLGDNASDVAEQLGATDSLLGREFGLEGVSNFGMSELKAELEKNPPQKFELARTVRVFNARFEFVELELKGSKVTSKEVTLPKDLIAVPSADVQRKLKTSYRLIDQSDVIAKAQQEVEELRKEIEKRFLRVIPGFGMAVLRTDRDLFDTAMTDLAQCVALFQSVVDGELEVAVERSVAEIAGALAPAIEANPTDEYLQWAKWRNEATALLFVKDHLRGCFAEAAKSVQRISVNVVIKGVTYESLKDERFLGAAKKAFPELEELFNEFEAARASENKSQHGNQ
jgi:hypothetical protein